MSKRNDLQKNRIRKLVFGFLVAVALVLIAAAITGQVALAKNTARVDQQGSPIHPTFPLLDENGENVLDSSGAVSTMTTCGACHDTGFIVTHSYHADVGLSDFTEPGGTASERPWDMSSGLFGKWNTITYRYLSNTEDERIDLSTADWLMTLGVRHVGGGPAVYSRSGELLTEIEIVPGDPETNVVNPETGELVPWDWEESGVVEMNCFLCHIATPNNETRIEALHDGNFRWTNTATLVGSGIVEQVGEGFQWIQEAFQEDGELAESFVLIQDPTNNNCGLCHGLVHDDVEDPLVMYGCSPERWGTITTGQIISPQRLSDSGMNLEDKEEIYRSWDVHAERLLNCTDCHYSLNNPLYYQETSSTQTEHLTFDPRRLEIGQYLERPLHQFARGSSAQGTIAPDLKDTMRRCDSCHSIDTTHEWLPYKERHVSALSCESCHIPELFSSANMVQDWTVVRPDGSGRTECRGVRGDTETLKALLTGYEPVLLPSTDVDGNTKLSPHNLITSWFWVYGDPPRPVRAADLNAIFLEDGEYVPGILQRFDTDGDGELNDLELVIDTQAKEEFVTQRLILLGLEQPRIVGEIQPYSINHDIATAEWAVQDCQVCHSEDSRLNQSIQLASFMPGGVTPEFVQGTNVILNGEVYSTPGGQLFYQLATQENNLYILGHDSVDWVDRGGAIVFVLVLLAILGHGGLRFYTTLRMPKHEPHLKRVYMYGVYERLWHWLQTFVIVLLLFTGLIIHKPDTFGVFSFRWVVEVHNTLAVILALNAALSLFYHLVSGEIQQYIPRPRGFFDQAISQAIFYIRGIFRKEEHPFEKTPEKKLNPLQQITYFGILNVLLPLQGITGILMWGAQRWPDIAERLGGLTFLGPLHTLTAWLFATFIVAHVYLTTTGYTPLAGIKSMIMGWDEVEIFPIEEHMESSESPAKEEIL